MEPKKYWNYFDVTQWFDFWYKHNQFYKGDPLQPQDSSFLVKSPGGELPYETDGDACRKFLNLTPKGDHLGVA